MEYMESRMQDHMEAMEHQWSEFMAWVDQLEAIMRAWSSGAGNFPLPHALPLDRDPTNGNILVWKDCYDEGRTPQEAFDRDRSYW